MKIDQIKRAALRRKYRVRKKVKGTPQRPRLTVFRSNRYIYAQIIDDTAGVTLACASTLSKDIRDQAAQLSKKEAAKLVGQLLAKQALAVGIRQVCFDRNRFKYHGRIQALAEAARQGGLVF
ncbi:MAG: 50S ribosomal protein L18 [Sedimentisphaerales bacterium]|jgi:large subunit ribosomal protein L18|nr:50S ribosomal protein L18 [Sedimentisphaerales bacterium]